MKKIAAALIISAVIISLFFIRVTQQTEAAIKAPILTLYSFLASPTEWQKWRVDLREATQQDSSKITTQKGNGSFTISYQGKPLNVNYAANSFSVSDRLNGKANDYHYTLLSSKLNDTTIVVVSKQVSVIGYLFGNGQDKVLADTHVADLKNFMETDSLRYGFTIYKTRIINSNLIEIRRQVLKKDQFTAVNDILKSLELFIASHHLIREQQPPLAEFRPNGPDSVMVRAGLAVNRSIVPEGEVNVVHMPKGSPFFTIHFNGRFNNRREAYQALNRYFSDHGYQQPVPPYEAYLNDKLPKTDTDKIEMLLNYSTY